MGDPVHTPEQSDILNGLNKQTKYRSKGGLLKGLTTGAEAPKSRIAVDFEGNEGTAAEQTAGAEAAAS